MTCLHCFPSLSGFIENFSFLLVVAFDHNRHRLVDEFNLVEVLSVFIWCCLLSSSLSSFMFIDFIKPVFIQQIPIVFRVTVDFALVLVDMTEFAAFLEQSEFRISLYVLYGRHSRLSCILCQGRVLIMMMICWVFLMKQFVCQFDVTYRLQV